MPVHEVPRDQIQEAVAEFERLGERLRSIVPDGDGAYVVTTEPPDDRRSAGGRETRASR